MKLAEALLLRADMQKKLASLRERVVANAVVQQGDEPHEDPNELLEEAFGVASDLEALVRRINETNLSAKLPDGRTITHAIAERDRLAQQHALLTAAIGGARKEPDRYGMREIKWVATIDVSKTQKQADDVSKKMRELNGLIQETNWKVSLDGPSGRASTGGDGPKTGRGSDAPSGRSRRSKTGRGSEGPSPRARKGLGGSRRGSG